MFRHMKKLLYLSLLAAVILAAWELNKNKPGKTSPTVSPSSMPRKRAVGSDVLGFYRLTVDFKTCELR